MVDVSVLSCCLDVLPLYRYLAADVRGVFDLVFLVFFLVVVPAES